MFRIRRDMIRKIRKANLMLRKPLHQERWKS
jgi:hypothetical protein